MRARPSSASVGAIGSALPLTLHIGINTGRVVAGRLGTAADAAYAVTGDAVNTAARLQSAAGAGQTLVSSRHAPADAARVRVRAAGTLALKGKAEPLQVYRLLGVDDARPHRLRGLAAHGLEAPLVGRDAELAQMLAAALDASPHGQAQVVSLVGAGRGRQVAPGRRVARAARVAPPASSRRPCAASSARRSASGPTASRRACSARPTASGRPIRWTWRARKVEQGMRAIGADDVEIALVVPVVGYILGLQSRRAIAARSSPSGSSARSA